MLEIVVVYFLCKGIGGILRKKNRNPLLMQILTVCLWIGGEIAGGVTWGVWVALSGQPPKELDATVYLFCLVGAAAGAGIAYLIAALIPAALPPQSFYASAAGPNYTGPMGDPTNPYAPPPAPQNPFADRR